MITRTKTHNIDGFVIEVRSHNRPDPDVAAKAILPLILELWNKKQEKETTVTHADHE
jgi:hypothetical protein